jgi:hypothetical protein
MSMKKLILILFAFFPLLAFSQTDSTIINISSVSDGDLWAICQLTDIQLQKIICHDKTLNGKVFNFIIKEYSKGKIVNTDNFGLSGEVKNISFFVNDRKIVNHIDNRNYAGIGKKDSILITLAGIYKEGKFRLMVKYPGMSLNRTLNGSKDYLLKEANSCSDGKFKIPINKEFPVLTYTPPFDSGLQINSYCLLNEEDVSEWYEKFHLEHYYIIYLEIK